jgi:hypothetical protein
MSLDDSIKDAFKYAFEEGYFSKSTYNDVDVGSCEESWESSEAKEKSDRMKVFGWAIVDKDGSEYKIRPKIHNFFGAVMERESYTSEDIKKANQEFPGCAPHKIITLYTDS